MVKAETDNFEDLHNEIEAKDLSIVSQRQFQNYHYQRGAPQQNCTQYGNGDKPYFQGNHANTYRGRGHGCGPQHFKGCGCGRANYQTNNGTYQYQYYTHDQQSEQ